MLPRTKLVLNLKLLEMTTRILTKRILEEGVTTNRALPGEVDPNLMLQDLDYKFGLNPPFCADTQE